MKRFLVLCVGGVLLAGTAGGALAEPSLINDVARSTTTECANLNYPLDATVVNHGGAVAGVAVGVYSPVDPC